MSQELESVIVVWYDKSRGPLENNLPLLWNGRRNLALGSRNQLTLVFLSGRQELPASYLAELTTVGYTIKDASASYQALAAQYPTLDQYGDYEKRCFLRWLVLESLYPKVGIIHYDADIIWNQPPETIAQIMRDRTLVLDGCPAFTVISNPQWLRTYHQELDKLVSAPRYGHDWRGTSFRSKIGSDQDLIDYLLQKKFLPQDTLPDSAYRYIENPLESSVPYQAMAFWHMQTDFVHYLNLRYMLEPYGLAGLAPNPLTTSPLVLKGVYLLGRLAGRGYQSRRVIFDYFLTL